MPHDRTRHAVCARRQCTSNTTHEARRKTRLTARCGWICTRCVMFCAHMRGRPLLACLSVSSSSRVAQTARRPSPAAAKHTHTARSCLPSPATALGRRCTTHLRQSARVAAAASRSIRLLRTRACAVATCVHRCLTLSHAHVRRRLETSSSSSARGGARRSRRCPT